MGQNCEIPLRCNTGANGKICENNGKPVGTLAADDCACECPKGFTGLNCEHKEFCTATQPLAGYVIRVGSNSQTLNVDQSICTSINVYDPYGILRFICI